MNLQEELKQLHRMLKIGAAAKFCGVSTETLRNWDRSGRLVPKRHPVTGYRYYQRKDLESFLVKAIAKRAGG